MKNIVWFPVHLKVPVIPGPSGQLAELIVYITSTRVDCIVTKSYWNRDIPG